MGLKTLETSTINQIKNMDGVTSVETTDNIVITIECEDKTVGNFYSWTNGDILAGRIEYFDNRELYNKGSDRDKTRYLLADGHQVKFTTVMKILAEWTAKHKA